MTNFSTSLAWCKYVAMEATSAAANSASASVRVPHQAITITTVTARNSAVNSIGVLQNRAPL
jgi:hypothetical protein